jgi:glutamine synthetase
MLDQQRDYVLHTVEERGVRLIRLWFTDVLGTLKSFAISPAELENALEDGMTFDGSSIDGFSRMQESDVLAVPDPDTFEMLPVGRGKAHRGPGVLRHPQPRRHPVRGRPPPGAAPQPADAAREPGLHVLRRARHGVLLLRAAREGPEEAQAARRGRLLRPHHERRPPATLRKQTIRTLETMSIPVEYSFHEDAPSQHEIDLRHTDALTMADSVMTFRLVVKEVAASQGVHATFMPKPLEGVQGSGMHMHLSLFRGEDNAFYDPDDAYNLSPVAKSFMAGLLRHAAEITAVTNQTVNSYKRLVPGFEAPVHVSWARNNRSGLIRVPIPKRATPRHPDRVPLPRPGVQPVPGVLACSSRPA